MITVRPIPRAVVPVDSAAAARTAAPNYDEFQSDEEIRSFIRSRPDAVLKITMAHCDVTSDASEGLVEGSEEALALARANLEALVASELTRVAEDIFFLYEMVDPLRPGVRQIGLGAMASTGEIRNDANPGGSIVRNEGIYAYKMRGRAALINATRSFIGTVNLAVEDPEGEVAEVLERIADSRPADFEEIDHKGNTHRVHVIVEPDHQKALTEVMAACPFAYVADGNHRSAAAVHLGEQGFLAIVFTAERMRIDPYHRLLRELKMPFEQFLEALGEHFEVREAGAAYEPAELHAIGIYRGGKWWRLTVKEGVFDPSDAVQSIDADILQRRVYGPILGIDDPTDGQLTFVGGDKGVPYLVQEVDAGRQELAFAMAPVTMGQFVDVCRQGRFMPPKSTWFEPKIQSGLVVALLD